MDKEISNQTPLFRFVSLRNPELAKRENQNKRFVFISDKAGSIFHVAVAKRKGTISKWDAMNAAAVSFAAFANENAIADLYPQHFELSDWITRNRNTISPNDLAVRLDGLEELSSAEEVKLWDNLYYQVLSQKDFYVKEAVIQLLVLQNILKNKNLLIEEPFDEEAIKQLLSARVVLSNELFDELALTQNAKISNTAARNYDGIIPRRLLDARKIQDAKIASENIKAILSEITEIQNNHRENEEARYKAELASFQNAHQAEIKSKLAAYQAEYNAQLRAIGQRYNGAAYDKTELYNQPDVEYPELPEFQFVPSVLNVQAIQDGLSGGSLAVLPSQVSTLSNISSVDKLADILSDNLHNQENQIVDTVVTTIPVVVVGTTTVDLQDIVPTEDLFKFLIVNNPKTIGNNIYMSVILPAGYDVQQFIYHLKYKTGEDRIDSYFVPSRQGNTLTLGEMFNNGLGTSDSINVKGISGIFTFTNGLKYKFEIDNFKLTGTFDGKLEQVIDDSQIDDLDINFTPNSFGYRRLGIADYQKVVSKICRYEAGEVANIENVMARELREKTTTSFRQTKIVETDSQELETEKMTDISTTDRFEMQTEIAKMLEEDRQFAAHADVSATYGPATINAGASYASNVSKQESNRQAIDRAKEITQRASERILQRVKNERTVSTTEEFTEENRHRFDNTQSGEHVSGVYRFINAVYRNRIYNYGKRLMYEFMIPQPAKLHQIAMTLSSNGDNNNNLMQKPIDPTTTIISDFTKITEHNYQSLAAKYEASVNEYPLETIKVNKSFAGAQAGGDEILEGSADIELPEGYITESASLKLFCRYDEDEGKQRHAVSIAFGDTKLYSTEKKDLIESDMKGYNNIYPNTYTLKGYKDNISFGYSILNYMAFSIAFSINLKIDETKIVQWKRETFEKIMEGYQRQLDAYNQSLAGKVEEGEKLLDSNPLFYRQIEQTVLRQNCISYLLPPNKATSRERQFGKKMYDGETITDFKINLDQTMDAYSSFVKFMEQAFEWDLMSYTFYPYYWANSENWAELYKFNSNDALFRSFMQAGMARVVVTVRPGFEEAVAHYMATGQIWNG
ncbi:MAG: hypothetical protein FWD66_05805, partial [Paludibacter sp.]|nr:hypothetical protein [Paludibacter sp.]